MGILRMSMRRVGGVGMMRVMRMTHLTRLVALAIAAMSIALGVAAPVRADVTYPTRPIDRGAGGFIADEAKLISDADAAKIRAISEKLLTDKRVPLIVCTITSMSDHGASGWTIERYAMNVFDEWGIGSKQYDYGILLLVSKGDRKARIELGAGWTRERDAAAANIMSMDIVPAFKRGDYSGGILKGVQQLDALARVASKPVPPAEQGSANVNQSVGATAAPSATTNAPASSSRANDPNVPRGGDGEQYSYSNSYSRGRKGGSGGIGGFSMACLAIPVIGIIAILRVLKGAIGWGGGGGGWGRSMYPGGYGSSMGGWGSGSSYGGSSGGGGFSSGGGGGFSGGIFGGGSSGGGGATGSW